MSALNKPIHPFILAIYLPFYLYSTNIQEAFFSDVTVVSGITLLFAIILSFVSYFFLRDIHKSSIIASISIFCMFFFELVHPFMDTYVPIRQHGLLWISFFSILIIVLIFVRFSLEKITVLANAFALILFLTTNIATIKHFFSSNQKDVLTALNKSQLPINTVNNKPNIYYIILDEYTSNSQLRKDFNYSNESFTNNLTELGFSVQNGAYSNYSFTYLSIASTLNMDYLNNLIRNGSIDIANVTKLIQSSAVFNRLHLHNYRIVHIGSGFAVTTKNSSADTNINYSNLFNDFQNAFINTTIFKSFFRDYFVNKHLRNHILKTFNNIPNIPRTDSSTFIMAHIVCPHPPFLFDSLGNIPAAGKGRYLDQLKYVNKLTIEMVEKIIDKDTSAVIIIQGDHGRGRNCQMLCMKRIRFLS